MARLRSDALRRRLQSSRPVDGVIQVGTGFSTPAGVRTVTHDDMTVVQAASYGYSRWSSLPRRVVEERIDIQRHAYGQAVACCVTNRWAAASVIQDYGVSPGKVRVVGCGRTHSPRPVVRDWTTPRFLFVGKDWRRKNGEGVLRAFERLRSRIKDARLDVVGDHPRISQAGVTGHGPLRVDVESERRTVGGLFESATCFVLPSYLEPLAISFSEAGAAGIPSIGPTVGGCGDLIEGTGRLVDPKDDEALYGAMLELSDPETAQRLGALAHERSKLFTWPNAAGRTLRALGLESVSSDGLPDFLWR
jgi:glycosyltransferase involved in cell wall biosynthesis